MPEKELSAIAGWTLEYPNDYIAREEVKMTAVSEKARLADLKLVEDIYGPPIDFDVRAFTNPVPGKEKIVIIKGLKGRPLEILLADFSSESWGIIRSVRENVKKVTKEEEKLICELVIAWSEKRWVNITSLLTARLLQYQDVLVFGGFLKSDAQATRKLDESTLSAHRQFLKEGLNKRLKLDDKKVREIQQIVRAKGTGRYGLETVLKVTEYQKLLAENADYKDTIDGYWVAKTEEAHMVYTLITPSDATKTLGKREQIIGGIPIEVGEGTTADLRAALTRVESCKDPSIKRTIEMLAADERVRPYAAMAAEALHRKVSLDLRKLIAERGKPNKPLAKDNTGKAVRILFDGSRLIADGRVFPAVSGRAQPIARETAEGVLREGIGFGYSVARQRDKAGKGPIPEGIYWIDVDELKEGGIRHYFGGASWGESSITLHPDHSTKAWGRGGFFIHGGAQPGSAGCIDLGGGGPPRTSRFYASFH